MVYEEDNIRLSQELFYYLISHRELDEKKNLELFRAYVEKDEVRELVKRQAEIAECQIEKYGSVIYLIPNEENYVLGFSKKQLKMELCRSAGTDKDYYLSQFVILTLLTEFYDSQGNTSNSRTFLKLGEFMNIIAERLAAGVEACDEEREEKIGLAFKDMKEIYDSLKNTDKLVKQKTNKVGFVINILEFLQKQGLIIFIEMDEMIQPTKKLTAFMDWNLLNKNNFERVRKVLGKKL